jgi:hypothetical protein
MKKLCVAILALSVAAVAAPVLMHGKPPASIQNDKQSDLMDIKGTVRSENTKITFVADEGGKSWDVVNPPGQIIGMANFLFHAVVAV